jgi:predicted RNA-binding Zn ribbon-like protein
MPSMRVGFPVDWLERGLDEAATDLDLAVLLVNSYDLLEDPPDRLHDLAWFADVLARVGHPQLAATLAAGDVPRLVRLRDVLRDAFAATDLNVAAHVLNEQLDAANAVFLLDVGSSAGGSQRQPVVRFVPVPDRTGYDALAARLPAAVAAHIAEHGLGRLGICGSDPCRCAFIDRTRAGTRRYCCSNCNDRYAARAYRRRRRGPAT